MATELIVFGDISVDVAVEVPQVPAADAKLWAHPLGDYFGGMGANVASAFAALGGTAALVAACGNDERGRGSLRDLAARGVDVSAVAVLDAPTFWTLALLADGGEKSLLQFATPAMAVPWSNVDWSLLDGAGLAHVIAEEGEPVLELMEQASSRGTAVSLDLEPAAVSPELADRMVRGADVVFVPRAALCEYTGEADAVAGAEALLARGPTAVVATAGADGCIVAEVGRTTVIAGHAVAAVDTTGAGDCFAGAFLYGRSRGWPAKRAGHLANFMAAQSVTALGSRGRLLSLDELSALPGCPPEIVEE